MPTPLFLHGLDSSGKGTKGTFLKKRFPHILCPDFTGTLQERLSQLENICRNRQNLILIGSSYGGLMATCHAAANQAQVRRIVLLAPALNYENFAPPPEKLRMPALLVVGEEDIVCPPDLVIPLAVQTFSGLDVLRTDDDHLLHKTFQNLDWSAIMTE